MRLAALGLTAQLFLGGAFGNASATVDAIDDDSMVLTLEVEIAVSTQAVIAHLAFDDEPQIALPLLDRGGGLFGITTELAPKNYAVVFEAVGSDEELSTPALISDLGAEFGDTDVPTPSTEPDDSDGLSNQTRQYGWLALALAAGSLAVLALWVIIGRDDEETGSDEEE